MQSALGRFLENIVFPAQSFHVYWERVLLQNKPEIGAFTFSASLYADGDIVFGYYYLPIDIDNIDDGEFDFPTFRRSFRVSRWK